MDPYLLLKWAHILSGTVLFGAGLGTAAHMWMTHRTGSVPAIAVATANTVRADWWFTASSGALQPATGAGLIWMGGYDPFAPWLLAAYALYLVFMLKTHPDEFAGGGHSDADGHGERWSLKKAIGGLLLASLLAAWMSEVLVGAAEGTGEALGLSPVFIGIVFLAVVGGAAESSSAVAMAWRNKMDLAVGIALGSCILIALFVAPVLVLASYFIAPQPLELSFSRAEVGALFMAAIIGMFVAGDGRSNWFKGVQLIAVYLVIALMFYFIPAA